MSDSSSSSSAAHRHLLFIILASNRPRSPQLMKEPPPRDGAGISCPTGGETKGEEGGPEVREQQRRTFSGSFRRVRWWRQLTGDAVEGSVCTSECQRGGMFYTLRFRERARGERGRAREEGGAEKEVHVGDFWGGTFLWTPSGADT